MPRSGKRVKYGYILSNHIRPNNLLISFYKAKSMIEIMNDLIPSLPEDSDSRIVNVLRVEIPDDVEYMKCKDTFGYTVYKTRATTNLRIGDLNPVIVHNDYDRRGFRVDVKLTRLYLSNTMVDIKRIFLDTVPVSYFKNMQKAKYNLRG